MSFKLVILAPPTHFPVGLAEFLQVYPQAQIEIYHPDYGSLGKYFFAGLVKDLLFKFRQISLHCQTEPENKTCDLYLEVAEVERPPEEEAKFPVNVWPRSRGSIDLRTFLDLPARARDELWEIQKTHNAVAPFLPHRESKPVKTERKSEGYDLSSWEEDFWGPPKERARPLTTSAIVPLPSTTAPRPSGAASQEKAPLIRRNLDERAGETLRGLIDEKKEKEEDDWRDDVQTEKLSVDWWSEKDGRRPEERKYPSPEEPMIEWSSQQGVRPFHRSLKVPDKLGPEAEKKHLDLLKEVTNLLMGEKDLSLEAMGILDIATVPEALDWFHRFCKENEIQENMISLNALLKMGYLWWQIKKHLGPEKEKK